MTRLQRYVMALDRDKSLQRAPIICSPYARMYTQLHGLRGNDVKATARIESISRWLFTRVGDPGSGWHATVVYFALGDEQIDAQALGKFTRVTDTGDADQPPPPSLTAAVLRTGSPRRRSGPGVGHPGRGYGRSGGA